MFGMILVSRVAKISLGAPGNDGLTKMLNSELDFVREWECAETTGG